MRYHRQLYIIEMHATTTELMQASVSAAAPGDVQDHLAAASQQLAHSHNAAGSAFCAQIVPAQVTFISSSSNMAPIATRKAALVRFREKKARSHFAPKVRCASFYMMRSFVTSNPHACPEQYGPCCILCDSAGALFGFVHGLWQYRAYRIKSACNSEGVRDFSTQ